MAPSKKAATNNSSLREYLDEAGQLPADAVIGHIVMFTIMDTPIERATLEKDFQRLGLNPNLLPPEINPLDAFKKATSDAKDTYPIGNGNTASVLCREVASDRHSVRRQITREIRDPRKQTLSYDKAIECVFYRPTPDANGHVKRGSERVRFQMDELGVTEEEQNDVRRIAQAIQARYQRYYQFLDGNKLRGVIRDYLKFLNAIELRGGVYFVHSNRTPELDKVRTLVDGIGNGCFMQAFPLVDLPNERKMIVDAFQREAAEKLQGIVNDVAKLQSTRQTITPSAYASIKDRYDTVMAQAEEYLRTLGLNQNTTASAAELALNSLSALQFQLMNQRSKP